MNNNIDFLLNEYFSIAHIPELKEQTQKLWDEIARKIYKLEFFKSADTGYKKSALFVYNNMFIWNTKDNTVSTKKILSPFGTNFTKLRQLFNEYKKELKAINNIKNISKNINIDRPIIHAEVLINILFLHNWNIQFIKLRKTEMFIKNTPYVYIKNDVDQIILNNQKLMKIKEINTKKISSITVKIMKEYTKFLKKYNALVLA